MICPDCLEEYQFLGFDIDGDTCEHRGLFRCECLDSIAFPEFITREMIEDEDLLDQLRISRLFHLSKSVREGSMPARAVEPRVFEVSNRHLELYLKDFSEQSLRQLK